MNKPGLCSARTEIVGILVGCREIPGYGHLRGHLDEPEDLSIFQFPVDDQLVREQLDPRKALVLSIPALC